MPKLLMIIITTIILLVSSVYPKQKELFHNLKNTYAQIKTMQGKFVQTVCSELEGTCRKFEGKFFIARPCFSRLEVISPEPQIIVLDSINLYIYLPKQKTVYIQPQNLSVNFFKIFDALFADSLRFKLSEKTGYWVWELIQDTSDKTTLFKQLKFYVHKQSNLIEQFLFSDASKNEIEFQLSNLVINKNLSPKLFKFTIPKGVRIVK
ncbi:MAG: outer membrane lipoprotein carrier protein LolA [candidate division WOR-3 bacterium]|nr:outer membrane lipoprotein carrier protein LolA [candidate division WOR-3 bacterium]